MKGVAGYCLALVILIEQYTAACSIGYLKEQSASSPPELPISQDQYTSCPLLFRCYKTYNPETAYYAVRVLRVQSTACTCLFKTSGVSRTGHLMPSVIPLEYLAGLGLNLLILV